MMAFPAVKNCPGVGFETEIVGFVVSGNGSGVGAPPFLQPQIADIKKITSNNLIESFIFKTSNL